MKTIKEIIEERKKELSQKKRKFNAVHFLTDTFYQLKGWEAFPKEHYRRSTMLNYARHAKEAKALYDYCDHDVRLALSFLYQMASEAKRGDFDWVISTIFKRWEKQKHA